MRGSTGHREYPWNGIPRCEMPLDSPDLNLLLHSQLSSPPFPGVLWVQFPQTLPEVLPHRSSFPCPDLHIRIGFRSSLQSGASTPVYPALTQISTPPDCALSPWPFGIFCRMGGNEGTTYARPGKRRAPATPEPCAR